VADFTLKEGDTAPAIQATLYDINGNPVNLTGATVKFRMRPWNGGALIVDADATIVGDSTNGVVEYQWVEADTDDPGEYAAEWVVDWALAGEQTWPSDGYAKIEIVGGVDDNAAVMPDLPDDCWPVDITGCHDFDSYPSSVQSLAKAMATQTLRMLTGFRVGGCPITVRPCSRRCVAATDGWYAFGPTWRPEITNAGEWINGCCASDNCMHLGTASISLPPPVGNIVEVLIDGLAVDPASYRVDNGNELVRTDGLPWPTTQDMLAPADGLGAFSVTYLHAVPVDGIGAQVAGVLACEYGKAQQGLACALPSSVVSITRAGVSMELTQGLFPNGMTGIPDVDLFIARWNPNGLKAPCVVWSPDLVGMRVTTWP